jgi:hypothetical protein
MSFVHCPSCHRAFDLRRQASCARCAAPSTALAGTMATTTATTMATTTATTMATTTAPSIAADPGRGDAVARAPQVAALTSAPPPAAKSAPGNAAERIVSMVAELAALIEDAPSEALEAAQRQLAQRGLAAPKPMRWLSTGESLVRRAARRVRDASLRSLAAVAHGPSDPSLVEGGSSNGPGDRGSSGPGGAARAVATRVASRLRSAWADLGNPPA